MAREYKILINGARRATSRPLDVTSPFDKCVVGRTYLASASELDEATAGAESAFKALVRQAVALNSSGKSNPSKKAKP